MGSTLDNVRDKCNESNGLRSNVVEIDDNIVTQSWDFKKAFNTVTTDMLLTNNFFYGITGNYTHTLLQL